jgi:hypothetical protein
VRQPEQTAAFEAWAYLSAFERVLVDPCPLVSGPIASDFDSWQEEVLTSQQLYQIAKATLENWKACERSAMRNRLLIHPCEFVPNSRQPIRRNQAQVDLLAADWPAGMELRTEAYDWWRRGMGDEPFHGDEVLPEGVEELMDDIEMELFEQANDDLQTVLEGGTPQLSYHRGPLLCELLAHRIEWREKFQQYFAAGQEGELENWCAEIQEKWLRLAVGGRLIERWDDPLHVLAYRWEFDWIGEGNWIREVALAGLRLCFDRICMLEATPTNKTDFQAIDLLARLVLSELRHAFSAEAPSSHLGQSEATLVVMAFPLWMDLPATTSISDDTLEAEWKEFSDSEQQAFGNFEWFAESRRWEAWIKYGTLDGPPELVEPELVCRALAQRFAARVVEEASRFGRDGYEPPSKLKDEHEALEFIKNVVADVLAFGHSIATASVPSKHVYDSLCIPPHRDDKQDDECATALCDPINIENSHRNPDGEQTASPLASGQKKNSVTKDRSWYPTNDKVFDDYLQACLTEETHLKLKTWLQSKSPTYFKKIGFKWSTVYKSFTSNRAKWWPQLERELRDAGIHVDYERTREGTGKKKPTTEK